jgi:type IX secretion system PorP/SprF family membrane protein
MKTSMSIYIHFLSICILLAASCYRTLHAQDPNYSHFFINEIYYNPGLTGINNGVRFTGNYRNLWQPIPGKFNSGTVALDGAGYNKMGLGLVLGGDNEGEGKLKTTSIAGNYSYRVVETRNIRLQLGVQGSYVRKTIDWNQFVFSDQLDEVFGNVYATDFVIPGDNLSQYVDFASGAAIKFNGGRGDGRDGKAFTGTFGVAVHHLAQPNDAFFGSTGFVPRKINVHGEMKFITNSLLIGPAFMYEKQWTFNTFQIGTNFSRSNMFTGVWFRNRHVALSAKKYDSVIFNFGLNKKLPNDVRMTVCYSYDFTISRLRTSSFGTHEISAVFEWGNKVLFSRIAANKAKKSKYRFIPCTDY